jgi:NADH-quinone oxidoreductase subunit C
MRRRHTVEIGICCTPITMPASPPNLDHPTLPRVRRAFPGVPLKATEFRGQTALIAPREHAHRILRFLRDDSDCDYNFLCDVCGIDYLGYPAATPGRFAVAYVLRSFAHDRLLIVKVFLDPSIDTTGIDPDPALDLESVTNIWPGAEWREREVYDMFGIRFRNHPDLRRILLWKEYPAHPLRKEYPLRGRGERETYRVVGREEA